MKKIIKSLKKLFYPMQKSCSITNRYHSFDWSIFFYTFILLFCFFCLPLFSSNNVLPIGDYLKCIEIISGDTIRIENNNKKAEVMELYGIKIPDQNISLKAKLMLEKLILNKRVIIQIISKSNENKKKAIIYLGNRIINIELLKQGLATVDENNCQEPYLSRWKSAEQLTKDNSQ